MPLLKLAVPDFADRGTFQHILANVAIRTRPLGIIGFVPADGVGTQLAILPGDASDVEEVLNRLCAMDTRYRIATTSDPRLVDIVPVQPSKDLQRLLELRILTVDISADTYPANWYMYLPDYCPEIRAFLERYYNEHAHPPPPTGFPGVNMSTEVPPPHLELHLKNVTVQDILNALATKFDDWAAAMNAPPPGPPPAISYPVYATGWSVHLPNTSDVPLDGWIHSVFTTFPAGGHE